ncbi:MAG: hypothetical protein JNM07_00900 [Phycisphaerae bacterium]|nr:hypothetical protein [Phycisphaerae bacterium]
MTGRTEGRGSGARGGSRRGVAAVLAMMFVVMFGSLCLAMAVMSQGNIRTAETNLHMSRAIGAAETGLAVGRARLSEVVNRFMVDKGVVDGEFGWRLWSGSLQSGDGNLTVLAPAAGYAESSRPVGIAQGLVNAHTADLNVVAISGSSVSPAIEAAPSGTDASVYRSTNWVVTPPVAIDADASRPGARGAAYQITYAPLAEGDRVRIIVTGYSSVGSTGSNYAYGSPDGARAVTRVLKQDVRVAKRQKQAMVAPSRIMIGKNVLVTGDLGARYTDVAQSNGHPITLKSDFYGLNARLDSKLADLYAGILAHDVDGDNRLRVNHPVESQGIPSASKDYNNDGSGDNAFRDVTGDGYVDEFDVFINHFDANGDGRVVLASALTQGTPAQGLTPEFTLDDDLALLIDSANPDRNRNGVSGWVDGNGNGRWDSGETMNDVDSVTGSNSDQVLGWRDGFIDRRDQYAKVRGRLVFKVPQGTWSSKQGTWRTQLKGSIVPGQGAGLASGGASGGARSAMEFSASDSVLPPVDAATFTNAGSTLKTLADGSTFAAQVAAQLGVSEATLPTYTEAKSDKTKPRYFRSDLADAYVFSMTGRHLYEKMPLNAPTYSDWYVRPRYENMTFKNVRIPEGNNGLFINCTFVGVTYVRSNVGNTHVNWQTYGKLVYNSAAGRPEPLTQPLDKSDFLRYTTGQVQDGPANYSQFPDPPVINGTVRTGAARDTKLYSNNLRFHDCLVVGSIVSDSPTNFSQVRNKLQFTGGTRFTTTHPTQPDTPSLNPDPADLPEIAKSQLLAPNYSVDIGQFNSPTDTYANGPAAQNVQLKGTTIAGVLDVRGNANIEGSLMMTFAPQLGTAPLVDPQGNPVGNPAQFNCTLGYFGEDDGDGESADPNQLPIVNGERIVGWDLDNDGLPDLNYDQQPTQAQKDAGAKAVPFYGYGRVNLVWNPELPMPDGIMLPLSVVPVAHSYSEGKR